MLEGFDHSNLEPMVLVVRLGAALLMGAIIGIERQWRHKMAGLRTNMLVAIGAAIFCMIAVMTSGEASPTRIAAQVASGIGFLGAGVIMREGLNIRGLNTAATLWCAAAAGAMAGSGFIIPAFAASLAILTTNIVIRQLTQKSDAIEAIDPAQRVGYTVSVTCDAAALPQIRQLVLAPSHHEILVLQSVRAARLDDEESAEIIAHFLSSERRDEDVELMVSSLSTEDTVYSAEWTLHLPSDGSKPRRSFVPVTERPSGQAGSSASPRSSIYAR